MQFTTQDVVRSAASIVTWDKRTYHNVGDGCLVEVGSNQVAAAAVVVPVEQVYPSIRRVLDSSHRMIAKRAAVGVPLNWAKHKH